MKQTAVEWYHSKVIELMTQREQGNIDVLEFRNQLDLLLDQAKAMEKEQMYKCSSFWRGKQNEIEKPMFDLYYNETYKL